MELQAWRRRSVMGSVAAFALAAACPRRSGAAEPPPETRRIRIQDSPIACYAPLYVAEALLKAEGFAEVEYVKVPTATGPGPALAEGRVDLIQDDATAYLRQIEGSSPVVVLAGIHSGCWELFAQKSVRSLVDLKGRSIAAQENSSRKVFVSAMIASVGLDPRKDVQWINHEVSESLRLFEQGKVDAFMGFVPEPQELRARKVGKVLINTEIDRPWSQYFCCLLAGHRDFVRHNPVATKRALRAMLKAADLCVSQPEAAARLMAAKGVSPSYDYLLQAVKDIGYRKWRLYEPEDTMRFWGLRLRELGFIKGDPNKLVSQGANWQFINELRRELKS